MTTTIALPQTDGLPEATTDLARVKADLDEFGYGIAKGVLSPEETARIRGILTEELEKDAAAGLRKESYTDRDAKNQRLSVLVDRHRCFQDLVEHPVVLDLVEDHLGPTYLGESYLLHAFTANVTKPGSTAMGLHSDTDFTRPYLDFPCFTRIMWFLDDFDEEVGATRVVPRSHVLGRGPTKDGSVAYESVPALGPAGSLMVFDGRLYHGTGANTSADRERAGLIAGYVQPWMRPMSFFPMILDPEVMAGASERVRTLCGYSTVNMGLDQPWKTARDDVAALAIGARRSVADMRAEVRPGSNTPTT